MAQQKPVGQSKVLSYLREKNPSMRAVDDSTIVAYLQEKNPALFQRYMQERGPQRQPSGLGIAGRNVNQAMGAWQQPFRESQQNLQRGNTTAGVLDAIRGTAELPFSVVGAAGEGYRNLPVAIGGDTPAMRTIGGALALPFDAAASIPNLASSAVRGAGNVLDYFMPSNQSVADVTGVPEEKIDATAQSLSGVNQTAGAYLGASAVPGVARGIGRRATASQIKHQTKTGASAGAGESLSDMRRSGSFAAQFNIRLGKTTTSGGEVVPVGAVKAREVVGQYMKALNDKIIGPATKAGKIIDGNLILKGLDEMRSEYVNSLSPDRAALATIDRMKVATTERLKAGDGKLTPEQAQKLKVLGNQYLEQFYKKVERRGGSLTPLEQTKQQALANQVSTLRQQLEALDPQIKQLNWASGAGLELAAAIEQFAKARLKGDPSMTRGSGITAAASGRGPGMTLFAVTELALFRPFRFAYHKAMGKLAGKIAGTPPEFASPDAVKTFPTESSFIYDEATGTLKKP